MDETGFPQLVDRINNISKKNDISFRIIMEIRPTTTRTWYDLEVFTADTQRTLARASALTIPDAVWYLQEKLSDGLSDLAFTE
jgi:hypothetical protein